MCEEDMAISLLNKIPMMNSAIQSVRYKYNQLKTSNMLITLMLNIMELFIHLIVKLFSQIQTYNYKRYFNQIKNFMGIFIYQYAIPIIYQHTKELYHRFKHISQEIGIFVKLHCSDIMFTLNHVDARSVNSSSVNFDSPNMNNLIDLLAKSLSEMKIKENKSATEIYETPDSHHGDIDGHSSTSCNCEKHSYFNHNNNTDMDAIEYVIQHERRPSNEYINQDIIEEGDTTLEREDIDVFQTEETPTVKLNENKTQTDKWKDLFPSSQPLIDMPSEEKAFELAEALREKRQDKTGRDAYEVDTVLVLLSQWHVIDDKSKHYAIDRANLLYLAICFGWSYALQKVTPTIVPSVTTATVTNNSCVSKSVEHINLQRQNSHDGISSQQTTGRKMRKNYISRSHGSVHSNDSGNGGSQQYLNHINGNFSRQNAFNNYYRKSFPPQMYHSKYQYNNNGFYKKQQQQ